MRLTKVLENLSTCVDSEGIESHYVVGSEAKFNLWLVGMCSGYVHPCRSQAFCAQARSSRVWNA